MICISLHQPWSSLCLLPSLADPAVPVKPYETRSFPCPAKYVGTRILIHAAKKIAAIIWQEPFNRALAPLNIRRVEGNAIAGMPFGCIIGAVDVVGCHVVIFKTADCAGFFGGVRVTGDALAFGDFSLGRYAWALRNPVMFKTPIAFKGMQGFFNVPDAVVAGEMRKAVTA